MKKIVIATDAWLPQVNGVVKCIQELKRGLEENGFEVILIHPGIFRSLPVFFYPEIKLSVLPNIKIKKIIDQEKPDYIHIVTEGPIGLGARAYCLQKKLKFTTANHTNFQVYINKYLKIESDAFSNVVYSYLKWFHNASNGTMVIMPGLKKGLEERGFEHVLLWPLGVDTELFKKNESISAKSFNFNGPVFTYFGRIATEKNVEEFLELQLPGTKLIVGDGPLRKKLESKYISNTIFTGYKDGQELVDLLSVSDVFVFPSLTDTFPLAIIEAFACGLPVACHDVMDLKILVKKDVGVLDKDLKKAALACLNLQREKCRQYALTFSLEESTKAFIKNIVKTT